jgi:endonuclease-3
LQKYRSEVPSDMESLLSLPGVGRKTANVVLGTIFHVPGIIIDTHAGRLSRRMGLSRETDAEKVEKDLMLLLPKKEWTDFSHRLVYHGRAMCTARKPLCSKCMIRPYCVFGQINVE